MHVTTNLNVPKDCLVKYRIPKLPSLLLLATIIVTLSHVLEEVSHQHDHTVNVALHLISPLSRSW